eukprot:scpid67111/ scgid15080/ 
MVAFKQFFLSAILLHIVIAQQVLIAYSNRLLPKPIQCLCNKRECLEKVKRKYPEGISTCITNLYCIAELKAVKSETGELLYAKVQYGCAQGRLQLECGFFSRDPWYGDVLYGCQPLQRKI